MNPTKVSNANLAKVSEIEFGHDESSHVVYPGSINSKIFISLSSF
jgi:hypothetical protein